MIIGLVTIQDVVESIFGDLPEAENPVELQAELLEDGSWLMDGLMPVDDYKEILMMEKLPDEHEDDYQTLAGMILMHLDEFPKEGTSMELGNYRYQVVKMDRNRIDKVLVTPLLREQNGEETEEAES